jgi:hypothetical protein
VIHTDFNFGNVGRFRVVGQFTLLDREASEAAACNDGGRIL